MTPQGAPQKSSSVMLVVLAVGAVCGLCCVGTLAAVAVPNFIKFGARSKQAEVKSNLKALYTAEKSYFGEHAAYSESVEEVGYLPSRGLRYRYLLAPRGELLMAGQPDGGQHSSIAADIMSPDNALLLSRIPPPLLAEVGIKGECPACQMTIMAVGNLDNDSTVDVWSVSTADRTIDGEVVRAGTAYKHIDDINE